MNRRNHYSMSIMLLQAVLCCLILSGNVLAQDSTAQAPKGKNVQVDYFYVHGMLGVGLDVYSSKDIEDIMLEDLSIQSIGFPIQYGLRGGFRNIAQVEFCKYSTSGHSIGMGGFDGGEAVSEVSVEMDLKATDILFKINPAFWTWKQRTDGKGATCLFLVLGNGDVTYRDQAEDGWEGSGPIYGLEWAGVSKYVSVSIGATYQKITFETTRLFSIDIPYEVEAKRFMIYTRLALGFGV